MGFLRFLDDWVVNQIFQRLVDWAQKQPRWFGEQCAWAYIAFVLMRAVYAVSTGDPEWLDWFVVGSGLLLGGVLIYASRSSWLFALLSHSGVGWRSWWLFWAILDLSWLISGMLTTTHLIRTSTDVALMACYYFAACKPPKPKEPKRKPVLSHAGGSA
jgi:hypothetical protein